MDCTTLKELKKIRDLIFDSKKDLNIYTDSRDNELSERADDLEIAVCDQSMDIEQIVADIENALCELSETEE